MRKAADAVRTHGRWDSPEYRIWASMIQRCHNPRCRSYANYGGRGIFVCDAWRNSFAAFLADIGERPMKTLTLERIDNDRGYEPGNCRWATRADQQKNRRETRLITFNGRTEPALVWSREVAVSYRTILRRLDAGWPAEDILTVTPKSTGRRAQSSSV